MKPSEIVREFFPSADNGFIEHVIWAMTGYPSFWNIPLDGKTPEECFRTQLAEAKAELVVQSALLPFRIVEVKG